MCAHPHHLPVEHLVYLPVPRRRDLRDCRQQQRPRCPRPDHPARRSRAHSDPVEPALAVSAPLAALDRPRSTAWAASWAFRVEIAARCPMGAPRWRRPESRSQSQSLRPGPPPPLPATNNLPIGKTGFEPATARPSARDQAKGNAGPLHERKRNPIGTLASRPRPSLNEKRP